MSGKIKKLVKSQKGDAVIMLSILVTGIIILVTAVVAESLMRSDELQSVQKQSVDNLYKAEEGIEYSLYANKTKEFEAKANPPFSLKVWENGNTNGTNGLPDAYDVLQQPTQNKDVVVTSQNVNNQNVNGGTGGTNAGDISKRTVFANMPSRYFDQVPLWGSRNSCGSGNCSVSTSGNDMESGRTYQVVLTAADFQQEGWDLSHLRYRLVLKCGSNAFTVRNLEVGMGCNFTQCAISGCTTFMNIDLWNGESTMTGKTILSDWFKLLDNNGNTVDLRNSKMVVQFDLVSGNMEEINTSSEDIKMCKQNANSSWSTFSDRTGGLSSLEIKKENENIQYHCCGYNQVCDQWQQVCDQWAQVCAQYSSSCCSWNGCWGGCDQWCQDCSQWVNGDCNHYHNGGCTHYVNGTCNHWCKNN